MSSEKVIDILDNELRCVVRAEKGCDRQCEKCDLVRDSDEIIVAYVTAINAIHDLDEISKIVKVR